MIRSIYSVLCDWKIDSSRKPILLRGARQTGKTFIVSEFGQREFEDYIVLNFERNPEYKDIFTSLDPKEIIERISLFLGKAPRNGQTLIFLDEIQECPKAIMALRYFYEEMPELHIIGAGSLLEFALSSENFRMPVGRIQYLYLYPLSFLEFLDAAGEKELRIHISELSNLEAIPISLHDKLIEYIRKYYIIGGMPAVVQEYFSTHDIQKCKKIQRSILDTYIDDFAKYARKSKHKYLQSVFDSIPRMVGQKFVYTQIDKLVKSRDLKEALELLETAGVVTRVRQTSGAGIPLSGSIHESYFKVIFLDVGLFHAISGIYNETIREKDLSAAFKGKVAEQFAGQEMIAYHSSFTRHSLFYWARKAMNSTAEVDYLLESNGKIIPIEIKSGHIGHMRSLHMFIDKYGSQLAVKISQAIYQKGDKVLSLPFYAIQGFMNSRSHYYHK